MHCHDWAKAQMKRSSRPSVAVAGVLFLALFFPILAQLAHAEQNDNKMSREHHTKAHEKAPHSTPHQPDAGDAHTYEHLPTGGVRVTRKMPQEHDKISLDLTSDGFLHAARVLEKGGLQDASRRALTAAARLTSGGGRAAWYDGKRWYLTSSSVSTSTMTSDADEYNHKHRSENQVSDTCRHDLSSCTQEQLISSTYNAKHIAPWLLNSNSIDAALRGYATHHARIIRAIKAGKYLPQDIRVTVYRPSHYGEGYGNRVLALMSVLAWCMVSGRVLLVDWTSSYALRYVVGVDLEWEYEHVKDLLQGMYTCVCAFVRCG